MLVALAGIEYTLSVLEVQAAEREVLKGVEISVTADKAAYAPGEPITLTLRAVNSSNRPVTLMFRTAQRFDFVVLDRERKEVWRWAARRAFAQVVGRETIPPSGALRYTATVEEKLAPGVYTATGFLTAQEERLRASVTVRVEAR